MSFRKKTKIKKGDLVEIISGKDQGKQGKILRVLKKADRVVVEGANQGKKHMKPTQQNPQGGTQVKEMPIHISNVLIVDPKTQKPSRIGKKKVEGKNKETQWVRLAKKSQTVLEQGK